MFAAMAGSEPQNPVSSSGTVIESLVGQMAAQNKEDTTQPSLRIGMAMWTKF